MRLGGLGLQLEESVRVLDRSGLLARPGWQGSRAGQPPPPHSSEPGEWQHGWQYHGPSSRVPFQGDRGVASVVRRSPSEVPLRAGVQRSSTLNSDGDRVQSGTQVVPRSCVRKVATSVGRDRSKVRVRSCIGRPGVTQRCMSPIKTTLCTSTRT